MEKCVPSKKHITLCLFDVLGVAEMTKLKEIDRVYS